MTRVFKYTKANLIHNVIYLLLLFILLFVFAPVSLAAMNLEDGEYTINYTVLKADNDSASMANDYFGKPAKLISKNGETHLQITLNKSDWIKSIQVGDVNPKVISGDTAADKRTIQFKVSDLTNPILAKIHVDIESMDYNHHYTIRFAMNSESITNIGATSTAEQKQPLKVEEVKEEIVVPPATTTPVKEQIAAKSSEEQPVNAAKKPSESSTLLPKQQVNTDNKVEKSSNLSNQATVKEAEKDKVDQSENEVATESAVASPEQPTKIQDEVVESAIDSKAAAVDSEYSDGAGNKWGYGWVVFLCLAFVGAVYLFYKVRKNSGGKENESY